MTVILTIEVKYLLIWDVNNFEPYALWICNYCRLGFIVPFIALRPGLFAFFEAHLISNLKDNFNGL
jgi:hypothetical protein